MQYAATMRFWLVAAAVAALAVSVPLAASAFSGGVWSKGSFTLPRPIEARSLLEVRVGEDGTVLVRGAEVTAVSDGTITARNAWGDTALSWTVRTDSSTEYVAQGNRSLERDAIEVGDVVSFRGSLDADEAFTLDATVVKDWSGEFMAGGRISGSVADHGDTKDVRPSHRDDKHDWFGKVVTNLGLRLGTR